MLPPPSIAVIQRLRFLITLAGTKRAFALVFVVVFVDTFVGAFAVEFAGFRGDWIGVGVVAPRLAAGAGKEKKYTLFAFAIVEHLRYGKHKDWLSSSSSWKPTWFYYSLMAATI